MCRYGMVAYKPHLACFSCRKTYKRRLMCDINRNEKKSIEDAKCPQCGGLLADMGLDFKSPSQKNIKVWKHLSDLYIAGITFHSCGCSGPGYIPKNKEALLIYLEKVKRDYIEQLRSWINYIEPLTKKETELRRQKNDFLYPPSQLTDKGTKKVTKEEVVNYWSDKIEELNLKINNLK